MRMDARALEFACGAGVGERCDVTLALADEQLEHAPLQRLVVAEEPAQRGPVHHASVTHFHVCAG
jgi:hypothetical protein